MLANILRHGFPGPVYPIHPNAAEVLGRSAYRSVRDVPGPIDLAVIAVPAGQAQIVIDDCAAKGVRGLLVLTAGFRETGPEGARLEQAILQTVRKAGMRMVGPNCLGIIDARSKLCAVFAELPLGAGHVALATQSGALGIALAKRAVLVGLDLARFVSMGNKADVSGNDLLLMWERDPDVEVVLLHLESIGNPTRFLEIASRMTRSKPIILVKGGRSEAGAKAAGSHTGALVQSDALVSALLEQAGVVRVNTVEALFDVARIARQPGMTGTGIAIATNSGGPSILLTDALQGVGLRLAELDGATLDRCRPLVPAGATVANPLDLVAGATPPTLQQAIPLLAADPDVAAVVAVITPLQVDDTDWATAIQQAARGATKPVVAVLFGQDGASAGFQQLAKAGIPVYTFPENAAVALAGLKAMTHAKQRPPVEASTGEGSQDVRVVAASKCLAESRPDGWFPLDCTLTAIATLGIPTVSWRAAADAASLAKQDLGALGPRLVIKADGPGLVHKTEAGAVAVDVPATEAESVAARILASARAAGALPSRVLAQQLASPGLELLVGAVRDARFGIIVTVALGGVLVEALHDAVMHIGVPSEREALDMLARLHAQALLDGVRGQRPIDRAAVARAIHAVGALLAARPDLMELEINPLRAGPSGVLALDARARRAMT